MKGYATEALTAIVDIARQIGVARLYALCHPDETAAEVFGKTEWRFRAAVTALGRGARSPWRAEQKAAAVAAWLVLAKRGRAPRSED